MNKCAVPRCTTGYQNIVPEGVSMHKFPDNQEMRLKWIRAIKRKDYSPETSARACSLHFYDFDFVIGRLDQKDRRKRKINERVRNALKKSALPSRFPNLPSYLTSLVYERTDVPTSSSSLDQENERLLSKIKDFEDSDVINDTENLKAKFMSYTSFPGAFALYPSKSDDLIFTNSEELDDKFRVTSYVIVKSDLSFSAFKNDVRCDESDYQSLMHYPRRIMKFSDFLNL